MAAAAFSPQDLRRPGPGGVHLSWLNRAKSLAPLQSAPVPFLPVVAVVVAVIDSDVPGLVPGFPLLVSVAGAAVAATATAAPRIVPRRPLELLTAIFLQMQEENVHYRVGSAARVIAGSLCFQPAGPSGHPRSVP